MYDLHPALELAMSGAGVCLNPSMCRACLKGVCLQQVQGVANSLVADWAVRTAVRATHQQVGGGGGSALSTP